MQDSSPANCYPDMATSEFKLINRTYGQTLVRIGGHYIHRKTLLLVASESLLILLALVLAAGLRTFSLSAVQYYIANEWLCFTCVTAVCQLAFYYNDLYDLRAIRKRSFLFARIFRSAGVAFLALAVLYYVFPEIGRAHV